MRSSIFNFEPWRAVARAGAPPAAVSAVVFAGCWAVLAAVFGQPNFQTLAVDALGPKTAVLVIGSSRAYFGVDPARQPRPTMTLAASYLDLASALALWQAYSPRLTGLQALVVEFGIGTLAYDTRVAAPYALTRLGLGPRVEDFRFDFDGSVHRLLAPLFLWRLTPEFLRTAEQFTGFGREPQDAAAGYIPSGLVAIQPGLVGAAKVAQAQELLDGMPPTTQERNLAALRQLLADAGRRGVRPALMRFPKAAGQRALYPAAWQDRVAAARAALPAVPFWDLSADPAFEPADFRDPDHLNSRGAARLAPRLDAQLRSLLE